MKHKHLFPWWAGYLLINPLRKLSLDPDRFLSDYIIYLGIFDNTQRVLTKLSVC